MKILKDNDKLLYNSAEALTNPLVFSVLARRDPGLSTVRRRPVFL